MGRYLMLVLMGFVLAGCVKGRVSQFHVLDSVPKSFIVIASNQEQESLEFRSYANLVSAQLINHGWHPATFDSADVAVFLQYQISQGHQVAFNYPIFGQVPTGSSTTFGTVSTFGNTATFNAATTQQTALGVVGSGSGSRTEYERAVSVTMYSVKAYRESQKMERLFEGEIRSSGSRGDLPSVMPTLIRGLLDDFPGKSGRTRTVKLLID